MLHCLNVGLLQSTSFVRAICELYQGVRGDINSRSLPGRSLRANWVFVAQERMVPPWLSHFTPLCCLSSTLERILLAFLMLTEGALASSGGVFKVREEV